MIDVRRFLRLTLALTLVDCYSPDLADCTVTCASDGDCADGQACTAGRCVREGLSCTTEPGVDALAAVEPDAVQPGPDGPPPDSSQPDPDAPPPPPDAPSQTSLRVKIKDRGTVTPTGHVTCATMECTYTVDAGVPITLIAVPLPNRIFESWEDGCTGQPTATCTITPMIGPETLVTAKFKKP